MRYLSVCSGIEAASVAWEPLGWTAAAFSEIDPFARAVLEHRWPGIPLHGDFTMIEGDEYGEIDLVVGGTPCQDFSPAGLRAGLDGHRGQLTLEFLRLLDRVQPRWFVWENVPGVLTANDGRAFSAFIGGLQELGYGWAYRVLDAQYFGVPQRRRRVFVIGHRRDGWRAGAVLFERERMRGDSTSRKKSQQIASALTANGVGGGGGADDNAAQANHLFPVRNGSVVFSFGAQVETPVLKDVAIPVTGRKGDPGMIAFSCKDDGGDALVNVTPTLRSMNETGGNQNGGGQIAVVYQCHGTNVGPMGTLRSGNRHVTGGVPFLTTDGLSVRRITPIECERLMGFPDDYTLVPDPRRGNKPAADQPRYHVLGNSMAVPCMAWIGRRIAAADVA